MSRLNTITPPNARLQRTRQLSRKPSGATRRSRVALPVFLLASLTGICVARISEAQISPSAAPSWLAGNRISLKVASRNEPGSVAYGFLMATNGDIQINMSERSARENSSGTILLISGRVMATQGLKLEPGYEIDTVDGAALSWQLASQLLERGAPGDPRNLKQPVQIDVVETKSSINVSTTSASGSYPPPWTVKGAKRK